MSKIGVFIGTRPELIKCMPLINSSDIYVPIFVEQHSDILDIPLSRDFHKIPITNFGDNRLNNIIMSIINSNIMNIEWKAILVQGDTAVAFAAAISAFHKKIKIIHLEAGLRTYDLDNPWPEEGYRKMIDSIANIALCPSINSAQNLINEKFTGQIEIVGNTSIDAINNYQLTPTIGNTVIVTLHRRENWSQIKSFFETIEKLSTIHTNLTFILPIHPNPEIKKLSELFKNVQVINPLPHIEMCKLLAECNCIISDSGGIQEEASFLGKRVFCCRKVTERSELINDYIVYTPTPEFLLSLFIPQTSLLPSSTIYGKGHAYLKINSYLNNI
jgi:UDP-N-acetylglucosamine 2-epimerase (non-hydrolysing)